MTRIESDLQYLMNATVAESADAKHIAVVFGIAAEHRVLVDFEWKARHSTIEEEPFQVVIRHSAFQFDQKWRPYVFDDATEWFTQWLKLYALKRMRQELIICMR